MKRIIKEYGLILIGAFLIGVGLDVFLSPFQLSSGGVGTFGIILRYLFRIPLSVTNLLFNAVLFVLGFRFLGKRALLKTVAGILFLSLALEVTRHLPALKEDLLLSVVAGGVLDGIGMGLVLRVDGSTGGIDFAGLIVKRLLPHIPIAVFMFAVNCLIFVLSGIVFRSYTVTFYSMIAMYVSSKITDAIMNIGDAAKSIYIISNDPAAIEQAIIEDLGRGVTEFYSKGAFSQEKRKTLLCVAKPKDAPKIVRTVREIDPNAFVVISDVREVLGEGFKLPQ